METADRGGHSSRLRAFLPLLTCILVFSIVLGWLYHASRARQARINFNVRLEGSPVLFYKATLNGSRYQSGDPCGLGARTLIVEVENAEPFMTNLNIWYAGANLGTIDLPHSRGTLALEISPTPNRVLIRGERFQKEIQNCSNETLNVPVGNYAVVGQFQHFQVRREFAVRRNLSTSASIRQPVATLALTADPSGAEFQLEADSPFNISLTGKTPQTIASLPQGQYRLNIWRGAFKKSLEIAIESDPTNSVAVKFDYAKVQFKSDPAGAEIKSGEDTIGTTPYVASLIPGSYRFVIQKNGYVSKDFTFEVHEGEQRQIEATLPNIAYLEAMNRAQSALSQYNPDFQLALAEVEKALRIQNDDKPAKNLREEILFKQMVAQAQALAQKNDLEGALKLINSALEKNPTDRSALNLKAEIETAKRNAMARAAEERRQRPQKVFSQTVNAIQYHEYFDTQTMSVHSTGQKIRSGILNALGSKPTWTIRSNRDMGDGIFLIHAEWKNLIARQRVVILIDQSAESTSTVYFRLWDYILGNNIQISFKEGVSDDSWRPLHKDYSTWTPPVVEKQRARSIQAFREKLETEFKSL